MTKLITDQQLDGYEAAACNAAAIGSGIAPDAVTALVAEVRRLRAQVAEMQEDSDLLEALRAYGVDNWDGYDEAIQAAAAG